MNRVPSLDESARNFQTPNLPNQRQEHPRNNNHFQREQRVGQIFRESENSSSIRDHSARNYPFQQPLANSSGGGQTASRVDQTFGQTYQESHRSGEGLKNAGFLLSKEISQVNVRSIEAPSKLLDIFEKGWREGILNEILICSIWTKLSACLKDKHSIYFFKNKHSINFLTLTTTTKYFINKLDNRGVANLISPLSKLKVNDPDLIVALKERAILVAKKMNPQEVGNTAWALAKLKHWDEGLMIALKERAISLAKNMNPQEVANTAWAFAKFKHWDQGLMIALKERAISLAKDMNPQDVANTAWAFAKFNYWDKELIIALNDQAIQVAEKMKPQDVANTVWAFATLKYWDQELMIALKERAIRVAEKMKPQGVANTVWAFATLDYLDKGLGIALKKRAIQVAVKMKPRDIATLTSAFDWFNIPYEDFTRALESQNSGDVSTHLIPLNVAITASPPAEPRPSDENREVSLDSPHEVVESVNIDLELDRIPLISKAVLIALEEHSSAITHLLQRAAGTFAIDLTHIHWLRLKLINIANGDRENWAYYQTLYRYLGIFCTQESHGNLFANAPPENHNPVSATVMKRIASNFFDLWIQSAYLLADNPEISQSPSGLILVEETVGSYIPLTYSRRNGVLMFHAFGPTDVNLLSSPMRYEDGLIKGSGAISVINQPHLIVIDRLRQKKGIHHKLKIPSQSLKRKRNEAGLSKGTKDFTNPFKLSRSNEASTISNARKEPGRPSATIEEITQRVHVQELPSEVNELCQIAAKHSPLAPDSSQIQLHQVLFYYLSDEKIKSISDAFSCTHPTWLSSSQVSGGLLHRLLLLWLLSGEKCLLGVPPSDLKQFHEDFIIFLKRFEEFHPLSLAYKIHTRSITSRNSLEKAITNDKIPLSIRVQLCKKCPRPTREHLFELLAISSNTSVEHLKSLNGTELMDALGQCKKPPINLCHQVNQALTKQDASFMAQTHRFVIMTDRILVELGKEIDVSNKRVLMPLSEGRVHNNMYQAIGNRLLLLNNQTSIEQQVRLLQVYGIQRATLRMKELIKTLSSSATFDRKLFFELLTICVFVKKILRNGCLNSSRKETIFKKVTVPKEGIFSFLAPNCIGGRLLRDMSRTHKDFLYLVPSTPGLEAYVAKLKFPLSFNNFKVAKITGHTRERSLNSNTSSYSKITLISQRVLPATLPSWPVIIDPTVTHTAQLRYHKAPVIRLVGKETRPDLIGAVFGEDELPFLDTALKDHFKELLERYEGTQNIYRQIQNASLTPENTQQLLQILQSNPSEVPAEAPPNETYAIHGIQFNRIPIYEDGSCLFRCFLKTGIMGEGDDVQLCRNLIASFLERDANIYRPLIGREELESVRKAITFYEGPRKKEFETMLRRLDEMDTENNSLSPAYQEAVFNLYILILHTTAMWGGYLEMRVIANQYNTRIVIKGKHDLTEILPDDEQYQRTMYVEYDGKHYSYLTPAT